MTPHIAVGISSVVGALLFLAAGYLIARVRSAPKDEEEPARHQPELEPQTQAQATMESLRQQLRAVTQERDQLMRDRAAMDQELKRRGPAAPDDGAISPANDALRRELQQKTAAMAAVQNQLSKLDKELAEKSAGLVSLQGQKETLERALKGANDRLVAVQSERDRLHSRLDLKESEEIAEARTLVVQATQPKAAAKLQQTDDELERVRAQLVQVRRDSEQELAKVRALLSQSRQHAEQSEQQCARLEAEKRALSDEVARFKGQSAERDDMALRLAMLEQRHQEAESLRADKVRLTGELASARRDCQSLQEQLRAMTDLDSEKKDLSIKVEVLGEQVKVLEPLREEIQRLRARSAEMEPLQAKIHQLEEENAQLRSKGIVIDKPPKPVAAPRPEGLGESLQSVLDQLSHMETSRGAVFADELGLLVAGTGEFVDAMAGMAAVFANVDSRVQSLFSLGEIQELTVANANQIHITVQPFSVSEDKILLTTLTVGQGPGRESIEQLIGQVASGQPAASSAK